MIVYEKIKLGTLLALKLHIRDIGYTIKATGKVVWSSYFTVGPDGQDRYDLGVEFVEIDEAERQRLNKYIFRYGGE